MKSKKQKETLDEFLTVRELAKWIKLSESHIYFLVNKNKVPYSKLGGKLLFERTKIRKWIDSQSQTPEVVKPKKRKSIEAKSEINEFANNVPNNDIKKNEVVKLVLVDSEGGEPMIKRILENEESESKSVLRESI